MFRDEIVAQMACGPGTKVRAAGDAEGAFLAPAHPGVELRANLKSVSHRCYLFEVAFVWELTKEIIHLPLG